MIQAPNKDLWSYHAQGHFVVIPVNTVVNTAGKLVMGAGLAKIARDRFPGLDLSLGRAYQQGVPRVLPTTHRIVAFPTKYHWKDPSPLGLVIKSMHELCQHWGRGTFEREHVYVPAVGCGLGGLAVSEVRPILEDIVETANLFDRIHFLW